MLVEVMDELGKNDLRIATILIVDLRNLYIASSKVVMTRPFFICATVLEVSCCHDNVIFVPVVCTYSNIL